jgi:broad specificity phosphatase PhoE
MRSLRPRGNEFLYQIHDPGLTPGGIQEAQLFTELYPFLRAPQIIITSHLRRALQMSLHISSSLRNDSPGSQSIRIIAHPDLQEVSKEPCDTGTPLDVLREEFPTINFPDALFPEDYPRDANVEPDKWDSIYDDVPELLAARATRIREFIKNELEEAEIILVTHGSFIHFLLNRWTGKPGSHSASAQLQPGEAQPMTIPGKSFPDQDFQSLTRYAGPLYPLKWKLQDYEPRTLYFENRDCGIFTHETIRNAVGRGN